MPDIKLETRLRIIDAQEKAEAKLTQLGYSVYKTPADNGHLQIMHGDHVQVHYYPSTGTFHSHRSLNPTRTNVKGRGLNNLIAWMRSLEQT